MNIKDGDSLPIIDDLSILRMTSQLAFKCHKCGWCCTNCDPIILTAADIVAISNYLKKPLHVISRKYTHIHKTTHTPSIKKTKPCGFYDINTKTCKIYPARPLICRSWPFLSGDEGVNDEPFVGVPGECPGAVEAHQTLAYIMEKFRIEFEKHPELLEQFKQIAGTEKLTNEIIKAAKKRFWE